MTSVTEEKVYLRLLAILLSTLWQELWSLSSGCKLLCHWEWAKLHKKPAPTQGNNIPFLKRRQMVLMNQTHTDSKRLAIGDVNPNKDCCWKSQGLCFFVTQHIRTWLPNGGVALESDPFLILPATSVLFTRSQRRLQTQLPSTRNCMLSYTRSTCIHMTSPCSQTLCRELEAEYVGCQHTADPLSTNCSEGASQPEVPSEKWACSESKLWIMWN